MQISRCGSWGPVKGFSNLWCHALHQPHCAGTRERQTLSLSPLELTPLCSALPLECFNGLPLLWGINAHVSLFPGKDVNVLWDIEGQKAYLIRRSEVFCDAVRDQVFSSSLDDGLVIVLPSYRLFTILATGDYELSPWSSHQCPADKSAMSPDDHRDLQESSPFLSLHGRASLWALKRRVGYNEITG